MYTTLAEERYRVLPDGRFELVELAASRSPYWRSTTPCPAPPAPPLQATA